jgi:hypothetical protein
VTSAGSVLPRDRLDFRWHKALIRRCFRAVVPRINRHEGFPIGRDRTPNRRSLNGVDTFSHQRGILGVNDSAYWYFEHHAAKALFLHVLVTHIVDHCCTFIIVCYGHTAEPHIEPPVVTFVPDRQEGFARIELMISETPYNCPGLLVIENSAAALFQNSSSS